MIAPQTNNFVHILVLTFILFVSTNNAKPASIVSGIATAVVSFICVSGNLLKKIRTLSNNWLSLTLSFKNHKLFSRWNNLIKILFNFFIENPGNTNGGSVPGSGNLYPISNRAFWIDQKIWPGGIVYYRFDAGVGKNQKIG